MRKIAVVHFGCTRTADLHPVIHASIDSLTRLELIEQWCSEKGMPAFGLRGQDTMAAVMDVLVKSVVPFPICGATPPPSISALQGGRHDSRAELPFVAGNRGQSEFILMAYLLSTPTTTNYVERQMKVTIAQ